MVIRALQEMLESGNGFFVLDGGLGTELERTGHDIHHSLWSARLLIDNPEAIASVNLAFAEAGADFLTTATYQATFPGLEAAGMSRANAEAIFRQAVRITRGVAEQFDPPRRLALSIGSYGAFLADGSEYTGDYDLSARDLADFHRDRLAVLAAEAREGDLIAFETLPNGKEAGVLAELLAEFPQCDSWFSFSCRDSRHLRDGTPLDEWVRLLDGCPQAAAIGANCLDPDSALEFVQRIREATEKPIVIYPNSGATWDPDSRVWQEDGKDAETFGEKAPEWHRAGAALIGGCCRTTPETIRSIRRALE